MASTLTNLLYHMVFPAKYRKVVFGEEVAKIPRQLAAG
jgi:REP element-mobilizing transposase RayT